MALNIVYVNSHDTGRYVGPYGYKIRTPHLQKLAEDGVLFRQAFSAAPTCSPSRCALITGQYPHNAGMVGLGNRGVYPFEFDRHLAHTLKSAGYETATWGRWALDNHLGVANVGGNPSSVGYDRTIDGETVDGIIDFVGENRSKPFFLSASFSLTHRVGRGFTSQPQAADDPRYTALPAPLADTPRIRADWAHFCSDANAWDAMLGRIFDAIDAAGLRDSTLIIATTDHGPPFPGMKCSVSVHGTGVFMILRGPQGFSSGKVVDAMVSHLDLFPTICELIGIARPPWLDGQSLLPIIRGEKEQIHEALFAEVSYHAGYEPMRALRTQRYVYVKRFGTRRAPVAVNCDASPSKDEWLEHGFLERQHADEMLFDTFYDPQEMNNLYREPAYAEILAGLRQRLLDWMARTNDPLLKGRVPMPATGWENNADELDPTEVKATYPPGQDPRITPWQRP